MRRLSVRRARCLRRESLRQAVEKLAGGRNRCPTHIKYLEGKGISWMVWCFDPEWVPTLIGDWEYKLTPAGEFAKMAMMGSVK